MGLGIGPWEIAIIVVLALVLIGPRRLPEIMKSLGKGLYELRRASSDFRRTIEHEVTHEQREEQLERVKAERAKYMEEMKQQLAEQAASEQKATSGDPEAKAPVPEAAPDASAEPEPETAEPIKPS